jgi:hypothetical protein
MSQKSYEIPYESVFYKRIKEKDEETIHSDRTKLEKIKIFAEHVKDNFKP